MRWWWARSCLKADRVLRLENTISRYYRSCCTEIIWTVKYYRLVTIDDFDDFRTCTQTHTQTHSQLLFLLLVPIRWLSRLYSRNDGYVRRTYLFSLCKTGTRSFWHVYPHINDGPVALITTLARNARYPRNDGK